MPQYKEVRLLRINRNSLSSKEFTQRAEIVKLSDEDLIANYVPAIVSPISTVTRSSGISIASAAIWVAAEEKKP
jgi:hypothetical protein